MKETPEDLEQLQTILHTSIEQAGDFLRRSFEMPTHSLSAGQLVHYLQGAPTVALATTTVRSEPRVAPIGAIFYRGHFYIPTVANAVRIRHVLKRPAVSLAHYQGNDLAIIVHGQAEIITLEHADFSILEELQQIYTHTSVREWGDGVFLKILAHVIYTYARSPEQYPASPSQMVIRPLGPQDQEQACQYIQEHWGADIVVSHGVVYHAYTLPGFVALDGEQWVGMVTYTIEGKDCEIVSLDSDRPSLGIGNALLEAVKQAAQEAGCRRIWLITTNDNLNALRFYQKRGFVLVAVHSNALEKSRQIKPEISLIGNDGIPLRDELELELPLDPL